jgi:hypothetical protein
MLLTFLSWLAIAGYSTAHADPPGFKESQLKAAFVYNFAKFVEWPADSLSHTGTPIAIGVLGDDIFRAELDKTVKGRTINGHEIVVRRIESLEQAQQTHILYVSAEKDSQFSRFQDALEGLPILTVGESATFADRGGIITFVLDGDKIRFEINVASAERAGLKISAQLQKLAKTITRKP